MNTKRIEPELRLQLILAQSGLTSRRKAEEWIRAGRVTVDGQVITHLGFKCSPVGPRIEVDRTPIPSSESKVYYLFNKPKRVLSTLHDPQGRPTLKHFLSPVQVRERVFPVGRLDWDAEGLMLLTNDGELAQSLQHPRFQVPKTYRIKVRGIPSKEALARLETGILLSSGKRPRGNWEIIKTEQDRTWLALTIREGEKHQVKNMMAAIGHPVLTIKRIRFGPLSLGRLAPGEFRPLTSKEIKALEVERSHRPLLKTGPVESKGLARK